MNVDLEDVLAALRRARGKGLTLKQLSGQLHLAPQARQPLRRALDGLLKQGRATYNGHFYRESAPEQPHAPQHPRDGERRKQPRTASKPPQRRAPAVMVEGARARREQEQKKEKAPLKAGAEVTGVIHLKPEGYGFVSPLLGNGGREHDVFVPPQHARGALEGDVGRARVVRGRDGRGGGEGLETVGGRRQLVIGI